MTQFGNATIQRLKSFEINVKGDGVDITLIYFGETIRPVMIEDRRIFCFIFVNNFIVPYICI